MDDLLVAFRNQPGNGHGDSPASWRQYAMPRPGGQISPESALPARPRATTWRFMPHRSPLDDPKTAALLGAVPPHRNSPDLVEMAHQANQAVARFEVDSSWDDPSHREGWYYRSDHLPYARVGVPAIFFSSLLHPDYHTPFDNPDRIDIGKLTRMTKWMYATGRAVAERDTRPALDPAFKLERCRDFTGNYCG